MPFSVTVLMWADILTMYVMWMMMTYLTNVWKLNFKHAAIIINVFWGIVFMMLLSIQFLIDTLMGNYWMLLLSSLAYSIGLGFLTMSTPPVLSGAMGTCSEYKPECIGEGQKILFYTALALTGFGMSGHLCALGGFMIQQIARPIRAANFRMSSCIMLSFCGCFAVIMVPIIGGIALPYIKPWSLRFGIPAICTVVATLIFLSGSCSYNYVQPQGSPLTTVFRVFVASASKIFYSCPRDASKLYERQDGNLLSVPHTSGLRCLDKAAIIVPEQTLEEQETNRWRLCRVTEVEVTKSLVQMIPMCMTFIIPGIVSSTGLTFFLAQGNHLNRRVGSVNVPLPILLWFYDNAKSQSDMLYTNISNILSALGCRKYTPPVGIATSMIVAVLCCITAAAVETRRLGVVKSHGLIDKPDDKIPMSMFWLLPQFLLLGVFDGISQTAMVSFLTEQFPSAMEKYMIHSVMGFFGVGMMVAVLFVNIVDTISEHGGKSWFQGTLNNSRLDNYYWTLATVTAANFVVYILVAIWYSYKDSSVENQVPEEFNEDETREVDVSCCCCCFA